MRVFTDFVCVADDMGTRAIAPSLGRNQPMTPEAKLASMGLTLPEIPKPLANYVPFKINGNTLYLSGQGPRRNDGSMATGKVGRDVTVEQAYEHAKLVGLGLLAAAKAAVGDLSKIEVLKVLGMVNAVPEFTDQPKVINGCSDLFVAVLGERGRHARSAVGMAPCRCRSPSRSRR
jgi:enamine deaminase RidA (YjgF/YER057c/UK114 family)